MTGQQKKQPCEDGTGRTPSAIPRAVLQHVHIFGNDLERMIAFWERGFGARLESRRTFGPYDGAVLDLGGGVLIYLKALDCEIREPAERSGIDHIAVTVDNLEESLAHLLSLPDVTLRTAPFVSARHLCAFIRTSDALVVEVMQLLENEA